MAWAVEVDLHSPTASPARCFPVGTLAPLSALCTFHWSFAPVCSQPRQLWLGATLLCSFLRVSIQLRRIWTRCSCFGATLFMVIFVQVRGIEECWCTLSCQQFILPAAEFSIVTFKTNIFLLCSLNRLCSSWLYPWSNFLSPELGSLVASHPCPWHPQWSAAK